ncbi:hypothetical protein [uncultured Maricaulis sp.]|uniref:hypothetical protein n=1 Tax=uncultured Maricaulis sp. TaxID=174710 RepID=UPI0030DD4254|tara:strand:- start:61217 stop:62071 length:855 start_codon:yes stop_codon:yes gene_type:complete
MKLARNLCLGLCALVLSGCNFNEMVAGIVPDDAKPMLAELIAAVSDHDLEAFRPYLNPEIDQAAIEAALPQILELLPEGPPQEVKLTYAYLGASATLNAGTQRTLATVHTLTWDEQVLMLRLEMTSDETGVWVINRFRFTTPTPEQVATPPAFSELTLSHKIFGVAAILVPLFVLFTLIAMFRTPQIKRRILWTLFILIGCYPQFAINWSTGAWWLASPTIQTGESGASLNLIGFLVFGASILREGIGPWVIAVCVPIGALFFWYRRMKGGPTRKTRLEERVES